MSVQEFFSKALPYASQASQALNIPTSVILAQWALESDFGRSGLAQANNLGGIKYSSKGYGQQLPSGFAKYASLDDFVKDYIRVLNLSYYDNVRGQTDVVSAVRALAASPYDEGHYHGGGQSLLDIIKSYNLTQYDGLSVAVPSDSGGQATLKGWLAGLNLPAGADKKTIAWALVAVGALVMLKSLGGDTAAARQKALEVIDDA